MELQKLVEERNDVLDKMEALNNEAATRSFSEDEQAAYEKHEARLAEIDAAIERVGKIGEARRVEIEVPAAREDDSAKQAELRTEIDKPAESAAPAYHREVEPTYGPTSERSWFEDLRAATTGFDGAAMRRLQEFGKRQAEERAGQSTTDAAGGYFVPPAYLVDQYAEVLRQGAPVASIMRQLPHPDSDSIKIPKFSSGTAVAAHTENAALQDTDAVATEVSVTGYRVGGKQQLSNRLLKFGGQYDQIILADLARAAATKIDEWVITGSGSGEPEGIDANGSVNSVTYTDASPTAAELYPKLLKAIEDIATNSFMAADFMVMHPRRLAWLLAELDSSSRPFLAPVNPNDAYGDINPANMAGSILGIPVITSTNVPTTLGSGTDEDEILVGVRDQGWLFTDAPEFAVSMDNEFAKDAVVVRVTQDVAFSVGRHPEAFAKITGTGLNGTL